MSLEVFLTMLTIVSVFTSLFTEGIKKVMEDRKKGYASNIIAGIVAIVLSLAVSIGYLILYDVVLTAKYIVVMVALVALAWLAAMVGYDKVIQALVQIRGKRNG